MGSGASRSAGLLVKGMLFIVTAFFPRVWKTAQTREFAVGAWERLQGDGKVAIEQLLEIQWFQALVVSRPSREEIPMRRKHVIGGIAAGGVAAVLLCSWVPLQATGTEHEGTASLSIAGVYPLAGLEADDDATFNAVPEEVDVPALASMPNADPQFAEQVQVIMRDLGLSEEAAIAHVNGTLERMEFRDAVYEELPDCVGGFDYDPYTSTMTVYSLSVQCDAELMARSDDTSFTVRTERTEQSIDDLQALADDLNANPPADVAGFAGAFVDDERNAIVVQVEDDSIPAFSEDTEPDPLLAASVSSDSRLNNVKVVVVRTDENVAE